MISLRNLAWSYRWRAVQFASTKPVVYYALQNAVSLVKNTSEYTGVCVTRETQIVIEGYYRSANTTTCIGFLDRQPGPVKLALHKHHSAQLLRAVHWDIPAVLLIRSPYAAILSHLALREEMQERDHKWYYKPSFRTCLADWVTFYSATLPYLDRMVVAPFEEVTVDISAMIRNVNYRFGTSFASGDPVMRRDLKYHALPNTKRSHIKDKLEKSILCQLEQEPLLRSMLNKANDLHREIVMRHQRIQHQP